MPGEGGECKTYAFKDIPLSRHNAAVGAAVYVLFGDRLGLGVAKRGEDKRDAAEHNVLKPLEKVAPKLKTDVLVQAAVLAGAVHDIGKASPFYLRKESYSGHEIVGAVLLHRAALELVEQKNIDGALVLELAANAVARHHAAMRHRHPLDYTLVPVPSEAMQWGVEALEELVSNPGCLNDGLPEIIRKSWVGKRLMSVADSMRSRVEGHSKRGYTITLRDAGAMAILRHSEQSKRGYTVGVVEVTMRELAGVPAWLEDKIPVSSWLGYVWMVSGAVIVADILVANSERRGTDEGAGPAYVESWRRELDKVESVEELAKDQNKAEDELRKALGPLLGLGVSLGVG